MSQQNKRRKLRKEAIDKTFLALITLVLLGVAIHITLTVICNWGGRSEIDYATSSSPHPMPSITETPPTTIPFGEVYKMSYEVDDFEYSKSDEKKSEYFEVDEEKISKYSEEDIRMLAGLIEAEAGIVSETTRKRVGCVILNRVDSEYFPNTIREVISQPGQYETYIKGMIPESPKEENLLIAEELLNAYNNEWRVYCRSLLISEKVVYQANSSIDQSGYSYTTLDEYGVVGDYEYHMVYGESILDYSDAPYNIVYMY